MTPKRLPPEVLPFAGQNTVSAIRRRARLEISGRTGAGNR